MKIVLTGGPCCGKSTLLAELKKRGYTVVEETAREVLSERKNFSLKEIQEEIMRRQIEKEEKISEGIVFLDRGVVDVMAYMKYYSIEMPVEMLSLCVKRYNKIFFLGRLPFQHDGLRVEKTDEEAEKQHQLIQGVYLKLGYDLIFVPDWGVLKRADFIEKYIQVVKGGEK
jgi:predicted ATPase